MQEKGGTSEIFLKYLLSHDLFLNKQLESTGNICTIALFNLLQLDVLQACQRNHGNAGRSVQKYR